jgi:glycosyltransferase involved in cell wall biosynthesis
LKRVGILGEKLGMILYPPMSEIEIADAPRRDYRSELGLPRNARLVTMVGRITLPKGQLQFVSAAKRVMSLRGDVVFLIVGDSLFGEYDEDYKKQVEQAIAELPEPQRVMMLGERTDATQIMAESDVVVFHSLWPEGFGLSLAEAMDLGRPVVATRLGGTAEIIENGVTGLAVEPGDVAGLSRSICKLLDDPQGARALGQAGQQRIRRILSPENIRELQAVLDDIVCSRCDVTNG